MVRVTPELLADCLDAVLDGRMTVEECVSVQSEAGEELRGLLEVALAVPPAPEVTPRPAFRSHGRQALLDALAPRRRPFLLSWPGLLLPARMFALLAGLALAFTTSLGGVAVYASQEALPGDILYPVKRAAEEVQLAFVWTAESEVAVHLTLAERRLWEVERLQERGGPGEHITQAAHQMARHQGVAVEAFEEVQDSERRTEAIVGRLQENMERQQAVLERAGERVPDQAKEAIAHAIEASRRGLERAASQRERPRQDDRPGRGPRDR